MLIQESFGFLLNLNARLIKRKLDSKIKKYDLTTSQWSLLELLSAENNLTQVDIANRLHSDIATTGSVVDRLVQKKLLEKTHLKNDRRAYVVTLLDKGRSLAESIEKDALKSNQDALEGLTEDEIENLMLLLRKVANNLL